MPYIDPAERKELDELIGALATQLRGDFRGRLNYTLSSLLVHLIDVNGLSYRLINDFVGMLECTKLEAYRRVAAPYEDAKLEQNGDVYP